jgi:hypothetical protein
MSEQSPEAGEGPKVVSLSGAAVPVVNGEPNPDIIKLCEQLLADAQSGRIVGMVVALHDTRNGYVSLMSGMMQFTHMLGTLSRLDFDINCRWSQAIAEAQARGPK